MRILKKDFLFSWLLSVIVMFALSYVWHGYFLNDFDQTVYPKLHFLGLLFVLYLFVGFAITFLYQYVSSKKLKKKGFIRGFLIGAVVGFFVHLIVYVLGFSFKEDASLLVTGVDFLWQICEQGIGGGVVGYSLLVLSRAKKLSEIN